MRSGRDPSPTRVVIALSDNLVSYFPFLFVGAGAAGYGFRTYYATEKGRRVVDAEFAELRANLPIIDVPTLIVWGKQDRLLPDANADRLRAAIAQSQPFRVDDCGHIPHEERPEIVVDRIAAFLAAHVPAA